jgi:hypothetical protein
MSTRLLLVCEDDKASEEEKMNDEKYNEGVS